MKFALVNGLRSQPSPRLRGTCCCCGEPTTSRCGTKRVWHWAHLPNQHCDPWWENETEWHRTWKGYFPEENQEVVHFDSVTGEKHVADVKTDNGLVIELQHSPMDSDELRSREDFYGEMIWIVNGDKFKKNFFVLDPLPDPDADFAQDIVFCEQRVNYFGRAFWRLSENPHHVFGSDELVEIHRMDDIKEDIEAHYVGHHLFDWKHPRTVWFDAQKPVYIDFGSDDFLLELKVFRTYGEEYPLWCVQYFSKHAIIETHGGVYARAANAM